MKTYSQKRRRKARLSKRQRHIYDGILTAFKRKNKNHDTWGWRTWAGHNTASCAYLFARGWGGRNDVDIGKLQTIVAKFGTAKIIYKFARDIPEANINKLQYEIIKRDDPFWMRKFAELPGSKVNMLNRLATVAEVMEEMI